MIYYAKLEEVLKKLEEYLDGITTMNDLHFAKKMLFSHELKANNQVEGYSDDLELIEDIIKKKTDNINGFIILLSICILSVLPQSIVMIRFIMLLQFIGIVPIFDALKKNTKLKLLYTFGIIVLTLIYSIYTYKLFKNQNFGTLFNYNIFQNIITIFRK